jgi:hypothetical protein
MPATLLQQPWKYIEGCLFNDAANILDFMVSNGGKLASDEF